MAYVYRHIRLDKNEPFYIGIGADSRYKRAHEKSAARRSEAWCRVANKTEYDVEILFDDVDVEFAKKKEIEFIGIYGRRDLGTGSLVNMTDGGDGLNNRVFTEQYRQRLSEAAKRREPQPQLQKIIEWRRNNRFFCTQETRDKLSKVHKGRKQSKQQIENGRLAKIGSKNPMYGKGGANSPKFKGMVQAFKDGVLIGEYEGINDCARKLNLDNRKVCAVVNGKRNKTGGFSFKRK